MTDFSYQRHCFHAERFCNLENPAQTRIYKPTFKLTNIRDITAQLISKRGLGETLFDAVLSHDGSDYSFKSVGFLSTGETNWAGHIFSL